MAYKYKHFIPQNVAPKGAKRIGVYNSKGNKVTNIPLGGLTPPTATPLYSFGLVSDCHTYYINPSWNSNVKFDKMLTHLEENGCIMCVGCGDFTQTGLYSDSDYDESQMANYASILAKHSIPVFEIFGNHENYYGKPITNHLDVAKSYTGIPYTAYTVSSSATGDEVLGTTKRPNRQMSQVGNDLFILIGQPRDAWVMSADDFTWLGTMLEANRGRRCFLFIHSYMEGDSGDGDDRRENSIFGSWGNKTAFVNLLKQYPNVILFHGHSHIKLEYQNRAENANFTEKNGFKSVHVPSLGMPRDIDPDKASNEDTPEDFNSSQGYIVDVYADCIVLNGWDFGWDFTNKNRIPLGTYKINTV